MHNSISEQVMRAYETVKEMLTDRGMKHDGMMADVQLRELVQRNNTISIDIVPNLRLVFYIAKMRNNEFKSTLLEAGGDKSGADADNPTTMKHIFVFKEPTTNQNRDFINANFPLNEVFRLADLQFNLSRHELVDPHALVPPETVEGLMARYSIKSRSQFPVIVTSDPMAKYLGMVPGDVVHIKRTSPTSCTTDYYRMCVADKPA
jgi:DNA-directed RNA polymerase subunit H (RpoH/RPB5)